MFWRCRTFVEREGMNWLLITEPLCCLLDKEGKTLTHARLSRSNLKNSLVDWIVRGYPHKIIYPSRKHTNLYPHYLRYKMRSANWRRGRWQLYWALLHPNSETIERNCDVDWFPHTIVKRAQWTVCVEGGVWSRTHGKRGWQGLVLGSNIAFFRVAP